MSVHFRRPRPQGYRKMEKEDPEDISHRRAQFLIYKVLEKADSIGRPSCSRIRIRRLKVRIGKRLKRLKKRLLLGLSCAKILLNKQILVQLTTCKALV